MKHMKNMVVYIVKEVVENMRYFLFGILLSLLGILISLLFWDVTMIYTITSGIGLFFLLVSIITSGVLVCGDRYMANVATESTEDRHKRTNITFYSLLISLPNFAVAVLFYYLLK